MAPTLGKRKRITREELEQSSRSPSPSEGSDSDDGEDLRSAFQKAFEAKFKPLEVKPKKKKKEAVEVQDEEPEEDSDWSGIDSEDVNKVEVIEYNSTTPAEDEWTARREMRAFMSSKPPSSISSKPAPPSKSKDSPADAALETAHLKNDLALQRLLRDSHLLSSSVTPSTSGTATPNLDATGSARHKSTDLHLLSLGAKTSIHAQKNMPMSHRKGIAAKARHREDVRRREAKENGIILEKEKRVKKFGGERERGVGGPDVGRFKGGTLQLSKRDVAAITGGRGGAGGGIKGKGKGKKGKR